MSFPLHLRILGTPTDSSWPGVSELPDYKPNFPKWSGKPLTTVCPSLGPLGCDLLQVHHQFINISHYKTMVDWTHNQFTNIHYKTMVDWTHNSLVCPVYHCLIV